MNRIDWGFLRSPGFVLICFLVAVLFVVTIGLVTTLHEKSLAAELPRAPFVYGDFSYEITEIEGMPCVVVAGGSYFGITCDWSKWQGE